ncbi:MAG TPA: S49 family peptidase, partial [Candidatus Polarisedimenticolia bacterium]|nr:S49 family peptidase [Candidatus Polarisedimenticolia bacterium]
EERALFERWLDRIYQDFVGKVAKGRGKTYEQIDAIAQGRIWTGEDALRLGLVDRLGGLGTAIREALTLARLDPAARVQLVIFPEPKGILSQAFDRGDDTRAALAALAGRAGALLEDGPASGADRVLEMPFVPLVN